jgi:hypothetical protein
MEPKPPTVTWRWVAKEARTWRWKELTWAMTEEDAAEWSSKNGHCAIARINGSKEVRTNVDGRH